MTPEPTNHEDKDTSSTPVSSPETEQTNPAISEVPTPAQPSNRNMWIGIVVALLALLIGYIALFTETKLSSFIPFRADTVALVNGEKIHQLEFENSIKSVTDAYTQQGVDVTDPATQEVIESEALKRLINTELLLQAANEAGYSADDARIDEQVAVLTQEFGGDESLETRLGELGLTEDMLRNDVREQIIVGDYLENETTIGSITVSEEELAAFYENLKTQYGEQLPPLEEIKTQMEADIRIQKQQGVLSEVLADLRATANIEVRL